MLVVAGLVHELRARDRVPAYSSVGLRQGEASGLARRVADIYAELDEANADLAEWARPEGEGTLAAGAAEGLLFEVLADGEPAGVVAAVRDDDHGMRGFCVQEICLDRRHLGRRLAPAVLQRLLDALPADDGDVLWGTIHPDNAPSLRNSLSIGRQVVGGYVWVTPVGLPGMR
jgi:L-amino acid N-acyltransferase YncA